MKRSTPDGYEMDITCVKDRIIVRLQLKSEPEAQLYYKQLCEHMRKGSINISANFGSPLQ